MGVIVLAGEAFNSVAMAGRAPVASPAAGASFPTSNLVGNVPVSTYFRFGSIAADSTLTIDTNRVPNYSFDNDGGGSADISDWTDSSVGASNIGSAEGTLYSTSPGALKLHVATSGAGNYAARYVDIKVPAGCSIAILEARLRGDGTRTVAAELQNLDTGMFLTSGAAWSTTRSDWATRSTASYATTTLNNITVESAPDNQPWLQTMTLRYRVWVDGAAGTGDGYADDLVLSLAHDFLGVYGHNLAPGRITGVQWRRSTDNFGANDTQEGSNITTYPQCFYAVAGGSRTERWHRLKFLGTPGRKIWLGKVVLGTKRTLIRKYLGDPKETAVWPVVAAGPARAYLQSDRPTRQWDVMFSYSSVSSYQEMLDRVFGAARGAGYLSVLVPVDTEGATAQGRFGSPSLSSTRGNHLSVRHDVALSFVESNLPFVSDF